MTLGGGCSSFAQRQDGCECDDDRCESSEDADGDFRRSAKCHATSEPRRGMPPAAAGAVTVKDVSAV